MTPMVNATIRKFLRDFDMKRFSMKCGDLIIKKDSESVAHEKIYPFINSLMKEDVPWEFRGMKNGRTFVFEHLPNDVKGWLDKPCQYRFLISPRGIDLNLDGWQKQEDVISLLIVEDDGAVCITGKNLNKKWTNIYKGQTFLKRFFLNLEA